jgi:TatD DNase family protein
MKLIDTHCHLANRRLNGQLPEVFRRAAEAGVAAFVCAAADVNESLAALALARQHPDVRSMAGIHPHEARHADTAAMEQIAELCGEDRCCALGEIGLDYHYDHSPRPAQREAFARQLDLARRLGMPVVIHTREAFEDTLSILAASGVSGERTIFHSFTGDAAAVRRILDFGATVSYSGIVTFRSAADIAGGAAAVPAERLLVETDAPFLSPEPVRKLKTNEPAHVAHVARFLAELRGENPEDLARQTTLNASRVLNLQLQKDDSALPPL